MIIEDEIEKKEDEETTTEDEVAETETDVQAALNGADLVQAAIDGNSVQVSDIFKGMVGDKIGELIVARKQEIAAKLVNPDDPETEPDQEEEDFVDYDAEDPTKHPDFVKTQPEAEGK